VKEFQMKYMINISCESIFYAKQKILPFFQILNAHIKFFGIQH